MSGDVRAAILAGGASSRMGANKALLRLHEGGPTVVEMVVARLREAGLEAPLLVTKDAQEYRFLGLECVGDDVEGAGALGGILTALNHAESERVLVVACDMPLLNVELLRYMVSVTGKYDALVPRWEDGGELRVEPLHAIYSVRGAGAIAERIAAGRLKVSGFVEGARVRYVEEEEIRRYDPELRSFYNVNTPEEWAELRGRGGGENIG
jgi:molybdopterin-guanine dinucleotide biosynthesis protein A